MTVIYRSCTGNRLCAQLFNDSTGEFTGIISDWFETVEEANADVRRIRGEKIVELRAQLAVYEGSLIHE